MSHTSNTQSLWRAILLVAVLALICGCPPTDLPPGNGDTGDNGDNGDNGTDTATCKCVQDIQVTIEARFLTVTDNFLEEVGVDIRGLGDPTTSTLGGLNFAPADFTNTSAFAFTALTEGQTDDNALATLDPTTSNASSFSILGNVLDDIQFEAIIQAAGESRILSTPSLTVTGGQTAFIFMFDEQPLLADLQEDFAETLTNIDPLIFGINTGPSFEVKVLGLQDDTDIVLEIRPSVGGTFNTPDINGEQIIVRRDPVTTRLSAMDGQTIMLGGLLNMNDDTETNGTIPLLGNVPILGSAFRNRFNTTDETELIILVTPTLSEVSEQ